MTVMHPSSSNPLFPLLLLLLALIAYSTYLALFTSARPIFTPSPGGERSNTERLPRESTGLALGSGRALPAKPNLALRRGKTYTNVAE